MKTIYQNIFFLLFGLIFGLTLKDYYNYSSSSKSWQLHKIFPVFSIENSSIAERLHNETRILCMILTSPAYHLERAIHVKNTWGRRCNKLLFISTKSDDQLNTLVFDVKEGHDHLWPKTREAFKYIYDHYYNEADWFLKTDDDTYVVMENLRAFLYPKSTHAPVYFGHKYQWKADVEQGYMAGGAYVLSKGALHRFATQVYGNETYCHYKYLAEDLQMGMCLANASVVAGDSRDRFGRNRFFPLNYFTYKQKQAPLWYFKYQYYSENKTDGFSDSAIAFHYTPWYEMYHLEYILYTMRPFGIEHHDKLPEKENMDYLLDKWRRDKPLDTDNLKLEE